MKLTRLGQYHPRNRRSQNHRAVQLTRRLVLVRKRVPPHNMRCHAALWQDIHILFDEVDIHHRVGVV